MTKITYDSFAETMASGNKANEYAKNLPMELQEYKKCTLDSILLHRKGMVMQNILAYKYYGTSDLIKLGEAKPYYNSLGKINQ